MSHILKTDVQAYNWARKVMEGSRQRGKINVVENMHVKGLVREDANDEEHGDSSVVPGSQG